MGGCSHPGAGKGPPIRKTTLKRDLLYILFVGVVAVFALQVAIRVVRDLPALYRLEAQSDQNAVLQVKETLRAPVRNLEMVLLDYSIWDDTYDFVEMEPGSEEWDDYLEAEYMWPWDTFFLQGINGIIYLDSDGSLVYRLSLDLETGKPIPELDLMSPAFREALTGPYRRQGEGSGSIDPAIISSGFLQTGRGPMYFVASEIHRSDPETTRSPIDGSETFIPLEERHKYRQGPSRGTLIFWRYFDKKYVRVIEEAMGFNLDFMPVDEASTRGDLDEVVSKLLNSPDSITRRETRDHIYWLQFDATGAPLLLVRQKVPARTFDARWVTVPVLAGFGASGLVLLVIGIFLSERVVKPVAHLRDIAMKIGEGNLRLTASASKDDELGELSQSINLMSANLLEAREHLEELAYKDTLTGLANRRVFMESLGKALESSRRHAGRVALLLIDLDGFKVVNDSAGHEAGDYVLQQVGDRLVNCLRGEDLVSRVTKGGAGVSSFTASRFGGDEFTVLIADLGDASSPSLIADRIQDALAAPYVFQGATYHISCSIGIAIYPEDGHEPIELVKNADYAMYTAKQSGKNQHRFYDPVTSAAANDQLRMRLALSRAIEEKQFRLHYQPLYGLSTGRMIGCEALLRWALPDGQSTSPSVFIPVAESAGLMKDIGHWVLEEACRQQRDWQDQGIDPPRTYVNISAHQFPRTDFGQQLEAMLSKYDIGRETLGIEITETSMMQGTAEVNAALHDIYAMGMSISLDDFGTGYSSLAMLKTLPIDNVKIDKHFIDGITESLEGKTIVKAVIAMCTEMGLSTTAEGVEVEEQLSFLKEVGCDYVQGYLLNRPMNAERMTALMTQTRAPNIQNFRQDSGQRKS
jgi:diguanylate cyclase (GGDEF)-like protein